MAVPALAAGLDDVEEQGGGLEAGPGVHLADHAAVDFFPGSEVLERRGGPGLAAGGEFGIGDEHVDLAGVEVDADLVAGLQQGEAAADDGFGGYVQDRGAAGGAGLAAVAHGGERVDAL